MRLEGDRGRERSLSQRLQGDLGGAAVPPRAQVSGLAELCKL